MKAMTFGKIKYLACLLLLATQLAEAQDPYAERQANREAAVSNIGALKSGTLVVRLGTNARKVQALRQMAASAKNDRDRQRFEAQLEETLASTRQQQLLLMQAFRTNYTFSKLAFMPDTLSLNLKQGTRSGIFLNADLRLDPSIQLDPGPVFLAYYGTNISDQRSGNEGITVADSQLQDLRDPFPFFTGRTSIRRMFQEFFNKKGDDFHFEKLVLKFQQRLEEFATLAK